MLSQLVEGTKTTAKAWGSVCIGLEQMYYKIPESGIASQDCEMSIVVKVALLPSCNISGINCNFPLSSGEGKGHWEGGSKGRNFHYSLHCDVNVASTISHPILTASQWDVHYNVVEPLKSDVMGFSYPERAAWWRPHRIRHESLASYIFPKWLQQCLLPHRSFLQVTLIFNPSRNGVLGQEEGTNGGGERTSVITFNNEDTFKKRSSGVCVLSPWIWVGLWLRQKWCYVSCEASYKKVIQILPGSLGTQPPCCEDTQATWRAECRCSGWQPASSTRHVTEEGLRWLHPPSSSWNHMSRAAQEPLSWA